MRRFFSGLLSVLVTVMVGGAMTLLGLLGLSVFFRLLRPLFFDLISAEGILAALVSGAISVLLLHQAARIGVWAGERTLAGRGYLPPRPCIEGVSLPRRLRVGLGAYLAGSAAGIGWLILGSVDSGLTAFSGIPYLGIVGIAFLAAAPAIGIATVRAVKRFGFRRGSGESPKSGAAGPPVAPAPAAGSSGGEPVRMPESPDRLGSVGPLPAVGLLLALLLAGCAVAGASPSSATLSEALAMEYEIVDRAAFTRTGESVVTNNARESAGDSLIGPLWGRFFGRTGGRPEGTPVAVYDSYESDHRGAYRLTLSDASPLPGGTKVEVPAGRYARFVAEGEQPASIFRAWERIWSLTESGNLHRAFTVDFEEHVSAERVEIHIALR